MPSVWEQPTAAPAQHIAGPKHLARRGFEGGGAHYRRRTGWIIAIVLVLLVALVIGLWIGGVFLSTEGRLQKSFHGFLENTRQGRMEEALQVFCAEYRQEMNNRLPFILETYYEGDTVAAGQEMAREWLQKCLDGQGTVVLDQVQSYQVGKLTLEESGDTATATGKVTVVYKDKSKETYAVRLPLIREEGKWLFQPR